MPRNPNLDGILIMLAAVALLSLLDVGLKLLSPHYPPLQVGALRGAASLPLVLVWIATTVGFRALLRVRWHLHLLRGVVGVAMMACFVFGVRTLPLSTAYALFFVAPLLITAFSVPVLGERVSLPRWLAIFAGLAGTLVILRPSGDGALSLAGLATVAAALGYAVSAITVRVLSRTDSTQSMVFWLLTSMTVGSGVLAAPSWVPIQPEHWPIIAGIGLTGAFGQYAITKAFSHGEASVVAPFEYSAMAWGVGMDLALWHVAPDAITMLGAAIIIGSGIYLVRRERDEARALARRATSCSPHR